MSEQNNTIEGTEALNTYCLNKREKHEIACSSVKIQEEIMRRFLLNNIHVF